MLFELGRRWQRRVAFGFVRAEGHLRVQLGRLASWLDEHEGAALALAVGESEPYGTDLVPVDRPVREVLMPVVVERGGGLAGEDVVEVRPHLVRPESSGDVVRHRWVVHEVREDCHVGVDELLLKEAAGRGEFIGVRPGVVHPGLNGAAQRGDSLLGSKLREEGELLLLVGRDFGLRDVSYLHGAPCWLAPVRASNVSAASACAIKRASTSEGSMRPKPHSAATPKVGRWRCAAAMRSWAPPRPSS